MDQELYCIQRANNVIVSYGIVVYISEALVQKHQRRGPKQTGPQVIHSYALDILASTWRMLLHVVASVLKVSYQKSDSSVDA